MKIPVSPPDLTALLTGNADRLLQMTRTGTPVDPKGHYFHWDKLRHLAPPDVYSNNEEWWFSVKMACQSTYRPLPLYSIQGKPFQFASSDKVIRELHWLDRYAAGNIQSSDAITNAQTRNTYLIRSLIEEAINSSQLEVIHQAVNELHSYLDEKIQGVTETERLLVNNPRLKRKLNFRQLALLRHALKHPRFSYIVLEHQRSHGISYDVARKDLVEMADKLKLLLNTKKGKQYYFVAPTDLEQRIAQTKQ